MQRLFSKNATGIAPDGRWYAGDVNAMQDASAAQADFSQFVDLAGIRIGESALQLLRYGANEARLAGAMRVDGIVRALSGVYAGAFTTAQRDAISVGLRPYGLVILNTTANQLQVNLGSDATPDWKPIGVDPSGSLVFGGQPASNYIVSSTRTGDAFPRFRIREDGQIEWGTGAVAPDTILARSAAGNLQINGNTIPVALVNLLANRPSASSVPNGSIFFASDTGDTYITQGGSWVQVGGVMARTAFDITQCNISNKLTYGDPTSGTSGPQITGLPDGNYYFTFGAIMSQDASGSPGHSPHYMSLALNGVNPTNDNEATWHRDGYETAVWHAMTAPLRAGGTNNNVKCVYRGGDNSNGHWQKRHLVALRLSP